MAHFRHDFITETKGRCFICSCNVSNPYSSTDLNSSISSSIHSLHCLSQYLKLDMRKVFTGSGPIPPPLVDQVKKSRLKAELCDECVVLSEKFSHLFREMEKMEMEATSLLETIRGKLENATKLNDPGKSKLYSDKSEEECMAKLEITEALRQDVMQKCYHKLRAGRPFPRLKRLTLTQVNAKKLKLEAMKGASGNLSSSPHSGSNYDCDDIQIPASLSISNDNGNVHYQDESDGSIHSSIIMDESSVAGQETVKPEIMDDTPDSHGMEVDIKAENVSDQQRISSRTNEFVAVQQKFEVAKTLEKDHLSRAIQPPLIIKSGVGIVEKPDVIKNPETGKYKCLICSREYASENSFRHHYKSAHLKVRFRCRICKKDSPFKQAYEKHYLGVHVGVRFKCGKCDKTFTQKDNLANHQKKFHSDPQR